MTTYVPAALRRLVLERAAERCEYCRFPMLASYLAFEVEHIVSEKHGGATVESNLALACSFCNRFKGSDLDSIDSHARGHNADMKIWYAPRDGWHQGRKALGVANLINRLTWMLTGTAPCGTRLRPRSTYVSFMN